MNDFSNIITLPLSAMEHGEGPVWDDETQLMYWVDLMKGLWYQYNPATEEFKVQDCKQPVGVVSINKSHGFLYGLANGFATSDSMNTLPENVWPLDTSVNKVRFNDGATSPHGIFYAGTMLYDGSAPVGSLYRINRDLQVEVMDTDLFVPNGMGWSLDSNTFYMVDSGQHCIFSYDYDAKFGDLSNRKVFKQFADDENPDGMCIDAEGNFWVAMWEGWRIEVLNPTGECVNKVEMPVSHPTSCCFGGKNFEDLYITTSQIALSDYQKAEQPLAGNTLLIKNAGNGRPEPKFG
ncbi:MAG: SMP-30/gluconolactonase/LRE family protein [Cyclobacteriaceae bacterium]